MSVKNQRERESWRGGDFRPPSGGGPAVVRWRPTAVRGVKYAGCYGIDVKDRELLEVTSRSSIRMVDDDDDEDKPVTMLVIVNGVGFPKLRAGSISWQGEGLPSCRKIDRSEADRAKHWLPLLATRSGYLGCTKSPSRDEFKIENKRKRRERIKICEGDTHQQKKLRMRIRIPARIVIFDDTQEQAVFKKNDSNQNGTIDESGYLRLRVDTKTSTRRKCEGRLLTGTNIEGAKEGGNTTGIATQDSLSGGTKDRA
ncbi:hypothetical protein QVD17_36088 [Tagetes erecta]|uniref:Uncharacterized protein n=1 Tax=Tagetes erecta TaxID=13708 RepID=A0AAD8NHT5_TARER|nr:hypothetical protein QVD17_36088 [Tagetes erecta]